MNLIGRQGLLKFAAQSLASEFSGGVWTIAYVDTSQLTAVSSCGPTPVEPSL